MSDKDMDTPQLSVVMENLISIVVKRQKEHEFFYDEEIYKKIPDFPTGDSEEYTMKRYQHLAVVTRLTLQHIMKFAKTVSGFDCFSPEDEITVLKAVSSEVFVLQLARKYNKDTDSVVLANTLSYTKRKFCIAGLENFADSLFHFCRTMRSLEVDQSEYALLTVIVIFSDRPGLLEPTKTEKIQEFYIETLRAYIADNRRQHKNRFARMLAVLGELCTLVNLNPELCLPPEIPPVEERLEEEYTEMIALKHFY